jgi:hypothetical protein
LSCIHAHGIEAADKAANAGAPDLVNGNMAFFEITKHSDVRQSESSPAAQGDTDRWSIRVATLLRYGSGCGK